MQKNKTDDLELLIHSTLTGQVSHVGHISPPPTISPPKKIRIPSQTIRDFVPHNIDVIHTVRDADGGLFDLETITEIYNKVDDFNTMNIHDLRVYLAILEKQDSNESAVFKSLREIANNAGIPKRTEIVERTLERLRTNKIYIPNTRKHSKRLQWQKTQLIEHIQNKRTHKIKNVFNPPTKKTSVAWINNPELWKYVDKFNTKQSLIASKFYLTLIQRITEKQSVKNTHRWLTIAELESKIFYLMVIHRNDYKSLLIKLLDTSVEFNLIESYLIMKDRIILNIFKVLTIEKNAPNKRINAPNKRINAPNKRTPLEKDIDSID